MCVCVCVCHIGQSVTEAEIIKSIIMCEMIYNGLLCNVYMGIAMLLKRSYYMLQIVLLPLVIEYKKSTKNQRIINRFLKGLLRGSSISWVHLKQLH